MSNPTEKSVRPTFRCLLDDLAIDDDLRSGRAAIRALPERLAEDPNFLLPFALVDVSHPILDKANLIAGDPAAVREPIKTIADRDVVKVKTHRHRGALWRDPDGVWWLLAAGFRRDDGARDFYRDLERFSRDSSPIAPTEADRRYLLLEAAYEQECEIERQAHAEVLVAVLDAARQSDTAVTFEVFGARVQVRLVPDEDTLWVLEMHWELTRFEDQDRFPEDVLAMVPGHDLIDSWDYLPAMADGSTPALWYTYVTSDWVDHMATTAELDDLIAASDWQPTNPSTDGSEHFSHYAPRGTVAAAYVEGIEITGLCGARFPAYRDYEHFPVCPVCQDSLDLLRQLGRDDSTESL